MNTPQRHANDLVEVANATPPAVPAAAAPERASANKVECNACPVLCQITEGRSGACDRYANVAGELTRVDPVLLLRRTLAAPGGGELVSFAATQSPGDGELVGAEVFVTGVGAGTTYPDYKPAPFIVVERDRRRRHGHGRHRRASSATAVSA